jgi:soluble P-type ATPase
VIHVDVPGYRELELEYLLCDFNGTLAVDGKLIPQVAAQLRALRHRLQVVVVTADTFGTVREELEGLGVELEVIEGAKPSEEKRRLVEKLGPERVAAVGNGQNDRLMLDGAVLSIAVVGTEGAAVAACLAATVLCHHVQDALNLLLLPDRLRATLRR